MNNCQYSLQLDVNYEEAQAKLNAVLGSIDNHFEEDIWEFILNEEKCQVDFHELRSLKSLFPSWYSKLDFDVVLVSKLMWIDSAPNAVSNFQPRFKGILFLWVGLARYNSHQLTPDNLPDLLEFFLAFSYEKGMIVRSRTLYSVIRFQRIFRLDDWAQTLRAIGLADMIKGISSTSARKRLKTLIPHLTDNELTYADWTKGGSFDKLTLDYGQYYVEHCMQFFENNIALATALSSTFREVDRFSEAIDITKSFVSRWITFILEGMSPSEIFDFFRKKKVYFSYEKILHLYELVTFHFEKVYRQEIQLSISLRESNIKKLATALGLNCSDATMDRIRVITWEWLKHQNASRTKSLLEATDQSLSFEKFLASLEKIILINELPSSNIPKKSEYELMGLPDCLKFDSSNKPPRKLVRLVESAGLTVIVALTGWRKSEFGFSLSDIKQFENTDILDQYAFPFRYNVNWFVYKSSGNIRQNREITFYVNTLIERMQTLTNAAPNDPCLFRVNASRTKHSDSTFKVLKSVTALWTHYAENYSAFKLIGDLASWNRISEMKLAGSDLCLIDQEELQRLTSQRTAEEWQKIRVPNRLQESYWICQQQLPLLEFFLKDRLDTEKVDWITRYQQRTLPSDLLDLFDARLSTETKAWIASLKFSDLNGSVTRLVSAELLEGCLYPTPHALRHMWVEAVYRRYDGDLGWLVRSQFKHISPNEWLSYIRNKDNRLHSQQAKQQVISSLVHNYLENCGKGYAGHLHTWLRRVLKNTLVMTPLEQRQFVDRISTVEIIDLKTNPWGYCLLKRRTQTKAECAIAGEPQRHNASPNMCLTCIHNLMQSDHVEWTLLHISTHVAALQNPNVPPIFKAASFDLVSTAEKQIKTFNPNHEALPELHQAIASFISEGNTK